MMVTDIGKVCKYKNVTQVWYSARNAQVCLFKIYTMTYNIIVYKILHLHYHLFALHGTSDTPTLFTLPHQQMILSSYQSNHLYSFDQLYPSLE